METYNDRINEYGAASHWASNNYHIIAHEHANTIERTECTIATRRVDIRQEVQMEIKIGGMKQNGKRWSEKHYSLSLSFEEAEELAAVLLGENP